MHARRFFLVVLCMGLLTACGRQNSQTIPTPGQSLPEPAMTATEAPRVDITPFPTRPVYVPGELVDYVAQTGDTLPALAARFNTTVKEIYAANSFIPADATTMPAGMPMKIPIYFAPFWGTPFQSLPDASFVNGVAQMDFSTEEFTSSYPGWLVRHVEYAGSRRRNGAQLVDLVATNFSISPRLLLAILEYQAGAVTQSEAPTDIRYIVGKADAENLSLYVQLVWAADALNNAFYGWRLGELLTIDMNNGRMERPDPWQNAASVALQYYFAQMLDPEDYQRAIGPDGFVAVYERLFGDPWQDQVNYIPGSLTQPDFALPYEPGKAWSYTGGPHTAWGDGQPFAAVDFAPPLMVGGCTKSSDWVTAVAPGIIVRSEGAVVTLDLDGDRDEHTGWVVFYLHVGSIGRVPAGRWVETGDLIGHPSCEGGRSTGTHMHIARKYNGEWIPAYGPLAFNLEGWIAKAGDGPYQGTLERFGRVVTACVCSDQGTIVIAGER